MSNLITGKRGWTEQQLEYLIENIGEMSDSEIGERVGKSRQSVNWKRKQLEKEGVIKKRDLRKEWLESRWSAEQEEFLIKNYNHMTLRELGENLGKPVPTVSSRVSKLINEGRMTKEINKNEVCYPLLKIFKPENRPPAQPNRDWSDEGIEWLIKNYRSMSKNELAVSLGKSVSGVETKLSELRKAGLISGEVVRSNKNRIHHGSNF